MMMADSHRLRSRTAGCLRGREAMTPHAGSAPLYQLHGPQPITYTFQQKRDRFSLRQFNHLDFISQFNTDIRYVSGQDNVLADVLSLASNPSLLRHHTTRWPHCRTLTTNCEHILASKTALRHEKQQQAINLNCRTLDRRQV
jgi:hypothetical protein